MRVVDREIALDTSQRRGLTRDLNQSSGGIELAVVALLFALGGLALDRWLGITPVLTIVLFLFGITGAFIKLWLGYDREMRQLEQEGPWARRS